MFDPYIIVVSACALTVTYLLATIPPRIFWKWWRRLLRDYAAVPLEELELHLPIKAQGLIGASAVTFNYRVSAYEKLIQPCLLFKERLFVWTIVNCCDPKYYPLLERLDKLARVVKPGKVYGAEDALLFQNGDRARRDHARIVKALGNMTELQKSMHEVVASGAKRLRKRCEESQVEFGGFSSEEEAIRIALEINCEILFGTQLYETANKGLFAPFLAFAAMGPYHRWFDAPIIGPLAVRIISWLGNVNQVDDHLKQLVDASLATSGSEEEKPSLLKLLVAYCKAHEEPIIEGIPQSRWVVEQIKGMIIASVLPVARSLSWSFALLCLNPTVQLSLQEELDVTIGSGPGHEHRPPTFDELKELKEVDAFVKETLRLFPVIPFIERQFSLEEVQTGPQLSDTVRLPPGSMVRLDLMALHRRSNVFQFSNKFDVKRWLPKKKGDKPDETFANYYMPFGLSNRSCIGKQLALQQLRVLIATLLRDDKLRPYDQKQRLPDGVLANGVLRCSPGYDVQFLSRFDADEEDTSSSGPK